MGGRANLPCWMRLLRVILSASRMLSTSLLKDPSSSMSA